MDSPGIPESNKYLLSLLALAILRSSETLLARTAGWNGE